MYSCLQSSKIQININFYVVSQTEQIKAAQYVYQLP